MALVDDAPVVLVTGGSSGIGRATALAFAARGAQVVVCSRSRHRAMAVVRAIELAGGDGYFIAADVSRASEVERLVGQVGELYGALHYAVNAAAVTDPVIAPLTEVPEEEFDVVHGAALKGTWLCLRAEIPLIARSGGGAVVNVAARDGLHGLGPAAHWAAAEAGVVALTRAAAAEHGGRGVRVNCVCPGPTDTALVQRAVEILAGRDPGGRAAVEARLRRSSPTGRVAAPEEVAETIVWLCREAPESLNGTVVGLDGGGGRPTG